jgi:hypothetical protein
MVSSLRRLALLGFGKRLQRARMPSADTGIEHALQQQRSRATNLTP